MRAEVFLVVALVAGILVAGCAGPGAGQAVPTRTTAPMGPVMTNPIPSETVATVAPSPVPTSKYVYEKNGRYYRQPPNFVCTESDGVVVVIRQPDGTDLVGEWCERGNLVYPPT